MRTHRWRRQLSFGVVAVTLMCGCGVSSRADEGTVPDSASGSIAPTYSSVSAAEPTDSAHTTTEAPESSTTSASTNAPTTEPSNAVGYEDVLALIENTGEFGVDESGGVAILGDLPPSLEGLDAFVVFPPVELGYTIVYGNTTGETVTSSTGREMSLMLNVAKIDAATRADHEAFFAEHDLQQVMLGSTPAWVGSSVTPDCPDQPEDGYNTTVLQWYLDDLAIALEANPVPECEADQGALDLEQVVQIASSILACSGYDSGTPNCQPLFVDETTDESSD
jgi:hypothetical protein